MSLLSQNQTQTKVKKKTYTNRLFTIVTKTLS